MIHYEIDFSIADRWYHTAGQSRFPSDANFDSGSYTNEDVLHYANILINAFMQMEHLSGYVNQDSIHCEIRKI